MTYKQLLEALRELTPQQLEMDATIQIEDEYLAVTGLCIADEQNGILETGHPVLSI